MINTMGSVVDAFWRAAAYCLHPRVIALSLLPLLLGVVLAGGTAYFFWEPAVAAVRGGLESWLLVGSALAWLESMGASGFRSVLAPLLVLAMAVPALVLLSLLLVAMMMTPALADLVARRRFPQLERKHGAGFIKGLFWSLGHTLLAALALLLSMPFWLLPPLVLLLPPLIWGWLSYRVFTFDVLAEYATAQERQQLLQEHRLPLMMLGVASGYLGAAPAAIWAFGALVIAMAPLLVLVSMWLYTLVFAFSALWFAHYALAALDELRRRAPVPAPEGADKVLPNPELPPLIQP
ncbi:EI24 domain-containing protein [Roseateles sp. BYS180W]|uniref:EI24 domain-containing protein n=1 Tax=Roseateles rivi TaxID=3299028 RepID=A0ABW7FVZ7_9BURK